MYTLVPFRRTVSAMPSLFREPFLREFFDMPDTLSMRVDVREKEDAYLLEADLPGVKKENIDLKVENDTLTISADMNTDKKEEKKGYVYSERSTGHMERSFSLEGIDVGGIKADYRDGVLMIHMPKEKPQEKPGAQKIAIGDGAEQSKLAQGE